jgi:quercetin dioxygenase-like cupin family protein
MDPIIINPGDGKKLQAFGEINTVVLSGGQTGGRLAVMLDTTPPGGGPPLHRHSNEDEIFLVVRGRINYNVEGNWTELGPGGAVFLPRGSVHCYRNIGETPSQHWIITTPSGFENFFERCADEFAKPDGPDMTEIVEISRQHGIEYIED